MDHYTQADWTNTALLTIDMQEDFSRPDAPAYIEGTDEIIPDVQRLVEAFRKRQIPVLHIVRLYKTDGSNVDLCRRSAIEEGSPLVAPGSDGAEIVEELKGENAFRLDAEQLLDGDAQIITPFEWILYKPRWGAFYGTDLEQMLNNRGINTVVVAGCNFPNCPRTTIYEASERDFRLVMARDAISGLYDKGVEELDNIGVHLMSVSEIISQLPANT